MLLVLQGLPGQQLGQVVVVGGFRRKQQGLGVMIQGLLYAKEMTFEGKNGLTSVLQYLTNGSVRTDVEDYIGGMRVGNIKGQPLTAVAETGAEDTSSDGS